MPGHPLILKPIGIAVAALITLASVQAQPGLKSGPASGTPGQGPRDLINKQVTARIVRIIDGDTVDAVIPPSRRVRVRFHGADAPERDEDFYQQALVFTRVFMFSRDVTIAGKDVDPYNRLVARIVVDGKDASESLIAAGLGCTFHRYLSDPVLDAALTRARSAHLGFWANGARLPRCVTRESRRK